MADQNENQESSFIRETIKPKKKRRGLRALRWIVSVFFCGLIAGVVFYLLSSFLPQREPEEAEGGPVEETMISEEETSEEETEEAAEEATESPSEERKEPESEWVEEDESGEETEEGENPEEETTEDETDRKIAEALEAYALTEEREELPSVSRVYSDFVSTSMAVVTNTMRSVDWLQNDREQTKEVWALILSLERDQILLLVNGADLDTNASLSARIGDTEYEEVTVLAQDSVTQMAVLSVRTRGVMPAEEYEAASFGSSGHLENGTPVIAVGAPFGENDSVDFGILAYQKVYDEVADMSFLLLYTTMNSAGTSGLLLNMQGQVIGWLTDFREDGTDNVTAAIGISSLTGILEQLKEGQMPLFLGVKGEQVPESAQEEGMPAGFYVTGVEDGSPAMEAGLQYGDIILSIEDTDVQNLTNIQVALRDAEAGQTVEITVMRQGRDEYAELVMEAELRAR